MGMDTHRVFGICGSDAKGTISVVPGIESGPIVQEGKKLIRHSQ